MKHVMKSLKHNGIFVPLYDYKGFTIKIQGQTIKLSEKTEPMAVAWARRALSTTIAPPDAVFRKNFMKEFLGRLKEENKENPKTVLLENFSSRYLADVDNPTLNQEMDLGSLLAGPTSPPKMSTLPYQELPPVAGCYRAIVPGTGYDRLSRSGTCTLSWSPPSLHRPSHCPHGIPWTA